MPVASADDRAKHEATRKSGTYVETVATLQAACTGIEKRLVQVEETLTHTEGVVTDRTLHEMSTRIAARLTETEDAVRHIETVVTSGPPDELLALQTLSANIDKRLAHVEEALGRTEGLVTDRTLHVMSAHIAARLTETEGAVRRIEGLVASGAVAELAARVDAAFAHTDDALRRIEAALESRAEVPSNNRGAVVREEPSQVVSTSVERQTRPAGVAALAPPRPSRAPWLLNPSLVIRKLPGAVRIARLAAVTVVLVGVLIFVAPTRVPINVAAPTPPPREEQQPAAPVVEPEPLRRLHRETPPDQQVRRRSRRHVELPHRHRGAPPLPGPRRTRLLLPPSLSNLSGIFSITSTPQGARVIVNGRAVGVNR